MRYGVPILVLALGPLSAQAEERDMEDVLVTGVYSGRAAMTSSHSVLDTPEIRALNKRSVSDLLKTLPGLLVEEQGGPGGLSAVSIRGGEANFTLVLLDGVPINDPTNTRGGGFDFSNLNPAMVERIELVRGTQSAIYGSDAIAGVINIVSRRPDEGHNQSAFLEGGENDYYRVGFSARGRGEMLEYALDLATRDEGQPTPGSERESDHASLRLGWRLNAENRLIAHYRFMESDRTTYPEQSGGPLYAASPDLDSIDSEDQLASLAWESVITSRWQSRISASRFQHDENYLSPGVSPYMEIPPSAAETDFRRDQLQWVNSLHLAEGLQLDVGADYRDEDGDSVGYLDFDGFRLSTDFELDRSSAGVFADLVMNPLDPLTLRTSVRHDDLDDFDDETSWQVGSRVALGAGVSLAANWGEAYKLPSFFALGHGLVGNPDLLPEKGESWDVGLNWMTDARLQLTLTWFHNDFEDLIDFDDTAFTNVNRKNVETQGVEVEATWSPADALSARFSGTYTDIDVKDEDTVLTGRPEWVAGVVLTWDLAPGWSSIADYRFVGEQWATSRQIEGGITEELDSYHRVDWGLQWQPDERWQLRLSLDNAFDERYETAIGFEAPERALRIGVQYSR